MCTLVDLIGNLLKSARFHFHSLILRGPLVKFTCTCHVAEVCVLVAACRKSSAGETTNYLTHDTNPFKSKSKLILKKKGKGRRQVVLAQRNHCYLAIDDWTFTDFFFCGCLNVGATIKISFPETYNRSPCQWAWVTHRFYKGSEAHGRETLICWSY